MNHGYYQILETNKLVWIDTYVKYRPYNIIYIDEDIMGFSGSRLAVETRCLLLSDTVINDNFRGLLSIYDLKGLTEVG